MPDGARAGTEGGNSAGRGRGDQPPGPKNRQETRRAASVVRRGAPPALLLALGASLVLAMLGKIAAAIVLTVTAVIGILSTSWLEAALVGILQPGKPRFSPRAVALLVVHVAVWGVFLAAVFQLRQRIELWAVAAGIACFLLGLSMGGMSNRGDAAREE